MAIFQVQKGNTLTTIEEKKIDLEKDIQKLTEDNLLTIFGLDFIKSEFSLQNFGNDTLAFDQETQSFVIIEYKRDRSFSVVDQGYAYLSLMLNNKDSFILEYIRNTSKSLDKVKIDWSQSKVIFIANSFTSYQQNAINFKDLPIELWEAKKYNNNIILFNQLKSSNSSESIKTISKNEVMSSVSKQVKKYTVEDLFKTNWKHSLDLYQLFIERIRALIEIDISATKHYIKIFVNDRIRLVEIVPQKRGLKLSLPAKINTLKDPEKLLRDVSKMGRWTNGYTEYVLLEETDIDYAFFLTKQVYERFIKL
ncbi:hypothetical protein KJ637_04005 [Patescibacteria group bacterium]|nr:hypothetical protein [Patescibacteria group bacterium]